MARYDNASVFVPVAVSRFSSVADHGEAVSEGFDRLMYSWTETSRNKREGKMLVGVALLGVCIMMVLLMRWLLAHDSTPDGNSDGLFAMRETKKDQVLKKSK